MSYNCDICSRELPDKSNGTFFDQNRVLTSPSYWEHFYQKEIVPMEEEMLRMLLVTFCRESRGFTVCNRCRDMLHNDMSSISSGQLAGQIKF